MICSHAQIAVFLLFCAGVGVNVTNDYPTLSLNDCINLHNIAHSANLKPISIEQLMARTLNVLEALIDDMEGVLLYGEMEDTLFMNLYYKYWLHSDIGREAVLQPGGEKVVIKGLDSDGQLVVTGEHGQGITLTARQYGFDIVKGIIVEKT
jgi:biotin-(acetyl-CoA carboxylase) ligase